jgi:tetratricopeptide (TPR) repeat protein
MAETPHVRETGESNYDPAIAGVSIVPTLGMENSAGPQSVLTSPSLPGQTIPVQYLPPPDSLDDASAQAANQTLDIPPPAAAGGATIDFPASMPTGGETLDVPASAPAVPGATYEYNPQAANRATGGADATCEHPSAGAGELSVPAAKPDKAGAAPLRQINRYVLEKFHARGGMGEVWLAKDSDIGRQVALKRMRKQMRGQQESFLWEAQVTGQLEHPGVVPVHELSRDDKGEPYYVMKFVHGQTLLMAIEEFHESAADASVPREVRHLRLLQVFLNLCQTVAYAHSRGVIHRDIKPENVMIGEYGETLVLDWGLAKLVGRPERPEAAGSSQQSISGGSTQTMAGSIKGTPSYMAPEMASGEETDAVDHQSDVFLLGGTLYHMLTGKRPRHAASITEYLVLAQKPTVPARKLEPRLPRPLEALCMKALEVRKEDRYASAGALAEDLQRYLAGETISAYRETLLERTARWCRRHRQALARGAAGLAVAACVVFGLLKYQELEQRRLEEQAQHAEELKQEEEKRAQAERIAGELRRQKQAQQDLAKFQDLAEEMRFFVASTNPVAAQAPFFDARAGLAKGQAALALAAGWGERLDAFPLPGERPALARDLYDLLLLLAQVKGEQSAGADGGREMLPLLDRAALLAPPTRSYHRLRAVALGRLGEPDAALEEEKARDPKTSLTALDHFLLGESYRIPLTRPEELQDRNGTWRPNRVALERAAEQYRQALRLDPNHYWSHFQLGGCLLSLDRGAEAVQAYGTCIALRPNSPWGYNARGLALTMLKRYNEAEADLNRALELDPSARAVRLNRGVLAWMRQDYDDALADFDAVLAPPAAKQLLEAAFYKAQLFGKLGKLDRALAEINRALGVKHPSRTMYLFRAQLFFVLGQDQKGLADLDSFLAGGDVAYDASSATGAGQRGHRLRLLAQGLDGAQAKQRGHLLQLAAKELHTAVERSAQSAEVFEDLGAVQENLGRNAEAIDAYSRALALSPKSGKILVMRGWAYEKLQPPALAQAQADFDAATQLEPDNAEAHAGLGYMQACRKSEIGARREAQRAVLYGAGDFLILHNAACVYAKLSEVEPKRATEFEDLALDHLRRAVDLWKRDRTGPNEIELIRQDPAFSRALRARREFQQLLSDPAP